MGRAMLDSAWRGQALQGMKEQTTRDNAVWGQMGKMYAPDAGGAPSLPGAAPLPTSGGAPAGGMPGGGVPSPAASPATGGLPGPPPSPANQPDGTGPTSAMPPAQSPPALPQQAPAAPSRQTNADPRSTILASQRQGQQQKIQAQIAGVEQQMRTAATMMALPGQSNATRQQMMAHIQNLQATRQQYQTQGMTLDRHYDDQELGLHNPMNALDLQGKRQTVEAAAPGGGIRNRETEVALMDIARQKQGAPPLTAEQKQNYVMTGDFSGPKQDVKTIKEGETPYIHDKHGNVQYLTPPPNSDTNSKEFRKAAAGKQAELLHEDVKGGEKATVNAADLQQLSALSDKLGSGKWQQLAVAVGPWAQALNVKIDGLSESEAFQAIVNKMVPGMRPAGSGATSDRDMAVFTASIPQLSMSLDGRKKIIAHMSKLNDFQRQRAGVAHQALNGQISPIQATEQMQKLEAPLFAPTGGASTARHRAVNPQTGQKIESDDGVNWREVK
jgi:hypothetical protein